MTKKSDLRKMEKEVEKTYGARPVPPIYYCKHKAAGVTKFTVGSWDIKVMTDEQEATIRSGKQIAEADGLHGTGSVMLCQDCEDAYNLAAGAGKTGWHAWKQDYDKRFPPPPEVKIRVRYREGEQFEPPSDSFVCPHLTKERNEHVYPNIAELLAVDPGSVGQNYQVRYCQACREELRALAEAER